MRGPKLSIIIPCYKVEKYLPKCLDSLMSQTEQNFEAICINDGSPDKCLSILKKYRKKYGEKIVIIDKKNEGVWRGRMDAIKIARGEYIGFLDSDDWVVSDFVEKMYRTAKEKNADMAVCGFDRIDLDTGKLYSREMCKEREDVDVEKNPGMLLEMNGAPWNKICKAEIVKKIPKLKNIPPVLDDMMFLQLLYLNVKKITFLPESLNRYMVRKDSIINTVDAEKLPGTYAAMKEVRGYYEKKREEKYLDYTDANAFLHLGISIMYRLSENKSVDFPRFLKENTKYLDENFPRWRRNPYMSLGFLIKNKGANSKLWVVRQFYRVPGGFRFFLFCYKMMINKLRVDVKW